MRNMGGRITGYRIRFLLLSSLNAKCPRCGKAPLFKSFLGLYRCCPACGLDFTKSDTGDGPSFFVMSVVSFIVVLLAVTGRYLWGLSMAGVLVFSIVCTITLSLLLLRPVKAFFVIQRYMTGSGEGEIEK